MFLYIFSNGAATLLPNSMRGVTTLPSAKAQRNKKERPVWITDFSKYWKYRYLTFLLLPGIIWFIVFKYVPIYGLTLAFKDFTFRKGIMGSEWAGFTHFQYLFSLPGFWTAFRNSIILNVYQMIVGFPAPIIFALMLNEIMHLRFKKGRADHQLPAPLPFMGHPCRYVHADSFTVHRRGQPAA
jgi:ABC-type polysaccharide transport system permease subunit